MIFKSYSKLVNKYASNNIHALCALEIVYNSMQYLRKHTGSFASLEVYNDSILIILMQSFNYSDGGRNQKTCVDYYSDIGTG